jgi:hypothetical protein
MNLLATSTASTGSAALSLLAFAATVVFYFVPTIVAWARRVPGKGSVTVVNVFLGWTVIGWIVALAMACRSRPQPQSANVTITH